MKEYGLLGEHLGHSLSPQIHSYFGNYTYSLIEKNPDELSDFFANCPYSGINITIPYKKAVIPFCDELDDIAARMGSVNTIRFSEGKTIGYNTDYYGFRYLLEKNNISVEGKKVIVLGSGGASLTVCCVLEDLGAEKIVVISRSGADNYQNISRHYNADIIVNTTPVGMFPNNLQSPIDLSNFTNCRAVVDIIYNPLRTKLLLDAESLNIPAINGLEMLIAQAKRAAEIFLEKDIENLKIELIVCDMLQKFSNLVLVGMPGCGKSTVGRLLAEHTNKAFLDTDDLVVEATGCSIPEIFAARGESAFRALETEAVLNATKQLGKIIATGGGAILKDINRLALRQNSTIVFLHRNLNELATEGRPLSKDQQAVRELYKQRLPIYRAVCNFEVAVDKNPNVTCKRILEAIKDENISD